MPAEQPLDTNTVEKLRRLGGDTFARQMIDIFLDFVPRKLEEARAAKEQSNIMGLEKAVHAVKSSASNLGAGPFRELASRMETLCRQNKGVEACALLSELLHEFERVKTALASARAALEMPPPSPG